jgi:hypothetical protein
VKRRGTIHRGYVYPFLDFTVGRVDQGQDFTGKGPILAVGRAKIIRTGAPGWPEGGGVLYKLLEGPMAGQNVFVYEGVDVPSYIKPGVIVNAGQPIATFRKGGSIEMGWANEAGVPLSHPGYYEGKETSSGKAMQRFLAHIESHTAPAQLGHIDHPSFGDQLVEQVTHPGKTAEEDAGAVGGVAGDLLSSLFGDIHPEALMLNIALIGGGAFLAYYGAALMLGVKTPGKDMAKLAAEGPAGAAGFKPPIPE